MNQLVTQHSEERLAGDDLPIPAISQETEGLIHAGVADSTLRAYRRATREIEAYLNGRVLSDAVLAEYITAMHDQGKSPSTIAQIVAAVKWQAKNQNRSLGELPLTSRTLSGTGRWHDKGRC